MAWQAGVFTPLLDNPLLDASVLDAPPLDTLFTRYHSEAEVLESDHVVSVASSEDKACHRPHLL